MARTMAEHREPLNYVAFRSAVCRASRVLSLANHPRGDPPYFCREALWIGQPLLFVSNLQVKAVCLNAVTIL